MKYGELQALSKHISSSKRKINTFKNIRKQRSWEIVVFLSSMQYYIPRNNIPTRALSIYYTAKMRVCIKTERNWNEQFSKRQKKKKCFVLSCTSRFRFFFFFLHYLLSKSKSIVLRYLRRISFFFLPKNSSQTFFTTDICMYIGVASKK